MSVRTAEFVMNDELLKSYLDIVFKIKKDFFGPITDDEAEKQKKEVFERVKLQREGKTPVELAVLIQTEYRKIIPGTPKRERVSSFAVPYSNKVKIPSMKINHKLMKNEAAAEWVHFVLPDLSIFEGKQDIKTQIIVKPANDAIENAPYAFYLCCVESAWCAIWDAVGKKAVSTVAAYNAFTGNYDGRTRTTSAAMQKFETACKELSNSPVMLTSEFDITKLPDDLQDDFREFFRVKEKTSRLPLREVEKVVKSHGVETVSGGFALDKIPPLYLMAKASGQIISKDIDLFEIADENGKIQKSNEERTLCKYYLLIRIYDILSNPKISNVIKFDDIIFMCGMKDADKDSKTDLRAFSKIVVKDWEKRGFRYQSGRRYFTAAEQKKGGGDKAGFIIHAKKSKAK